MRKTTSVLILIIYLSFCASLSAQWENRVVPLGDHLYYALEALSRESGTPLFPEGTHKPWTYEEAKGQLKRIDYEKLSSEGRRLYNEVKSRFPQKALYERENLALNTSVKISPSLFNDFTFTGTALDSERLVFGTKEREAVLEIPLQFSFYDAFVMEAVYSLIEEPEEDDKVLNLTNIPLDTYDIDWNVPQIAYVSYGRDDWSIVAGRIQNNWGYGEMGTLYLSDSLRYHETIRARAYWENFGYSFQFITLDPRLTESQADNLNTNGRYKDLITYEDNLITGGKYFLTHTLDFVFPVGFHFGITEGLIMGGYNFELNPSHFNPMVLFHNWFTNISYQGNAIHQIEMDYTWKNNLLYSEIVLDQFQAPSESDFDGLDTAPFTFGLLTGWKRTDNHKGGLRTFGAEALWTSPYLYTNTNGSYYLTHSGNEYHITGGSREICLGFEEGPDRLAFALYREFDDLDRWRILTELRYTLRGTVELTDEYPWTADDLEPGEDASRILPVFGESEQEIRFTWEGEYRLNDRMDFHLWTAPLYLVNRLDDEPDTLSLEAGISFSFGLNL